MHKKKVLLITDWYEPGYKAGGPIQSCKNIVATLSSNFDFYILTSDRDLGETKSYVDVDTDKWVQTNKRANVFYASPGYLTLLVLKKIIKELAPDVVYFNSMFSKDFTLRPLYALRSIQYSGKVILAPRGMLHKGALSQKSFKKKFFLSILKNSGLTKKIFFHATDMQERNDILHFFKKGTSVDVIENIPNVDCNNITRVKKEDQLKIIFLSRIHPKKNLNYILKILSEVSTKGKIVFDVYGTHDDVQYLNACRSLADNLAENICVHFFDPLQHNKIFTTLHKYHLFVLPTLGENFGHAIFEALSSGCPVLISDQTPWRDLEHKNAGWDVSLQNRENYKTIIEQLVAMNQQDYNRLSEGASNFAKSFIRNTSIKEKYLSLFA